mmetsp:Transcript_3481/g.7708  ORF Transcript_3481/g.7708 Transcript_3481/m.7708 type:complete len:112 (+) Transcript_3481:78-413(+)
MADTGAQGADMTSKNSPVEGNDVGNAPQEEQDLSVFVQNLLTQMSSRFQQMSEAIVTRIDEMGDRIDGLEKSISELMAQAGVDEPGEAANTSSGSGAGDLLDDGNNAPTDD